MKAILETHDLSKNYGRFEAVKKLNLKLHEGSICAFLGQNGAGKSTTIRMLLGMTHPSSGSGKIFGMDITDEKQSVQIRKKVAFVAEDKRLYDYMTVSQILRFTKSFFPGWRSDLEKKIINTFELPLDRRIKKLSKGMRTKLALTLSLARGSKLLVLDEPTEGLDPLAIENLLEIVVSLAADGCSIFFSSHQIAEVEQIADHVCMIHKGRLVVDDDLEQIRENYRFMRITFPSEKLPDFSAFDNGLVTHVTGSTVSFITNGNAAEIMKKADLLGAHNIDVEPTSLKEIFLEYVKNN